MRKYKFLPMLLALLTLCACSRGIAPAETSGSETTYGRTESVTEAVTTTAAATSVVTTAPDTTSTSVTDDTFAEFPLTPPEGFPTQAKVPKVELPSYAVADVWFFLPSGEGWYFIYFGQTGINSRYYYFRTDNFGQTWWSCNKSVSDMFCTAFPNKLEVKAVFFADSKHGVIICAGNYCYYDVSITEDGGNTWNSIYDESDYTSSPDAELLFPIDEFKPEGYDPKADNQLANLYSAVASSCVDFRIEQIDEHSAYIVFEYEKDGETHQKRVVYDASGVHAE